MFSLENKQNLTVIIMIIIILTIDIFLTKWIVSSDCEVNFVIKRYRRLSKDTVKKTVEIKIILSVV